MHCCVVVRLHSLCSLHYEYVLDLGLASARSCCSVLRVHTSTRPLELVHDRCAEADVAAGAANQHLKRPLHANPTATTTTITTTATETAAVAFAGARGVSGAAGDGVGGILAVGGGGRLADAPDGEVALRQADRDSCRCALR